MSAVPLSKSVEKNLLFAPLTVLFFLFSSLVPLPLHLFLLFDLNGQTVGRFLLSVSSSVPYITHKSHLRTSLSSR